MSPDELRAINLSIFQDPRQPYLRSGPFGAATEREVEQRIRNVSGRRLRRIINAVPAFDDGGIRPAWSHFMALCAGTHPWPDANHRTGHIAFAEVCMRAWQVEISMSPADATALTVASKGIRDTYRRAGRAKASFYSVAELSQFGHPYRVLYRQWEDKLHVDRAIS